MRRVVLFLALVSLLATPVKSWAQSSPQWIDVKGAQGAKLRAVVFRPDGNGPFPVVVVLSGDYGLRQRNLVLGRDFARAGFVIVVGCYFRTYEAIRVGNQLVNPCPEAPSLGTAGLVDNVVALMDAGRRTPGVRPDRVALVGVSYGGGIAVVAASSGVDVQAVVSIAGPIGASQGDEWGRRNKSTPLPITLIQNLRAPLLILHGTQDKYVPVGEAREYEKRARALGKDVQAYYYEGGTHPLYDDPTLREDVVRRSVEFLIKYLRP